MRFLARERLSDGMDPGVGMPSDLEERAVERLGAYRTRVEELVRRTQQIEWLTRGGQREPWDAQVARVWSVEEALQRRETFRPMVEAVWASVEALGRTAGLIEVMEAAEALWIARFEVPDSSASTYDRLFPHFDSDVVGALRETVLDDVVPVQFFRRSIGWYEKGHWLCAIDEHTGAPVVF